MPTNGQGRLDGIACKPAFFSRWLCESGPVLARAEAAPGTCGYSILFPSTPHPINRIDFVGETGAPKEDMAEGCGLENENYGGIYHVNRRWISSRGSLYLHAQKITHPPSLLYKG